MVSPDLYFLGQQIIPPSRSKIPPICFLFCFSLTPLYHCVSLCSATPNSWEHQLISTFQQPSFSELDAYHLENDKSAISICVLFLSNGNQDIAILIKKYYESAISYQQSLKTEWSLQYSFRSKAKLILKKQRKNFSWID